MAPLAIADHAMGPSSRAIGHRVTLAGQVLRVGISASVVALAVWLGGLVALGAIAAPVVFSVVSYPSSADAMTIVFRRFDTLAMSCAAVVLVAEAMQAGLGAPFTFIDRLRTALSVLAAGLAVLEGAKVSPRIAALHCAGAVRGVGAAGSELATLHDLAEGIGKVEVGIVVVMLVLRVVAQTPSRERAAR